MSFVIKNVGNIYFSDDREQRTPNGHEFVEDFTYHLTPHILKGIVTDNDAAEFPYLVEFRVRIPVSILLCFLKQIGDDYILLPELYKEYKENIPTCAIAGERLETKFKKPNPSIGELVLIPMNFVVKTNPLSMKVFESDYGCHEMEVVENVQFARFFADLEQSKVTLKTTRERYYFLQKLLFTVEMEETETHVKDFKAFFKQHMRSKPAHFTFEDWSKQFFSVRQDDLLQTYKSGSKFTDDIMSDIHRFIQQMQYSYNTIWGVIFGMNRLNTLNHLFLSDWFNDQTNLEETFLYQKANLRLYFEHDEECDRFDFEDSCKTLYESTMAEHI